ncbi:hypothetical protein [Armatimonas sp.]|uniref:hypothetical protein n=1 Tax=Armatimonas sp. TaxID=1872638 RepID=UPI00286C597C|nr:hypothetical protein [Armatimonas sp.]
MRREMFTESDFSAERDAPAPAPPPELPVPNLSAYERPSEAPAPLVTAKTADKKLIQRLDPMERLKVAELAKWAMLIGLGGLFLWLKAVLWSAYITSGKAQGLSVAYSLVPVGATLAAFVATALFRSFAAKKATKTKGSGYKAVDAVRDWAITGVITGVLAALAILIVRAVLPSIGADKPTPEFFISRFIANAIAAIIGLIVARKLALRGDSVMGGGNLGLIQLLPQAALVGFLALPFNSLIDGIIQGWPFMTWATGVPTLIGFAWAGVTLKLAWDADKKLRFLQGGKQGRDSRYVATGGEALEMNFTVIGGRESGKTVLLAGAYKEWMENTAERYGVIVKPVDITPVNYEQLDEAQKRYYLDRNLDYLSDLIYTYNQWPPSTQGMREFKFDVFVRLRKNDKPVKVARINLLDYPGSLLVTSDHSADAHKKYWNRIADSDGILFVGDISSLRRGVQEEGLNDVHNAFRAAMDILIDGKTDRKMGVNAEGRIEGNGKNRVIPVGMVMTKCDECVDLASGLPDHVKMDQLIYGERRVRGKDDVNSSLLRYSGPFGILQEWEEKCRATGPGFADAEIFKTTAITASRPANGPDGQPDLSRKFEMISPQDTTPTNCATPLLWLTARALRWNVTTFTELRRWLLGSTDTTTQRHLDAIRHIERVVELWQTAIEERRATGK